LPEGWEGGSPLNIPGLSAGLPLDDPWDAVAKAHAPGLSGDEVRFAVTADGRTIGGGPDSAEALEPLARALKARVEGPFWAIAVPDATCVLVLSRTMRSSPAGLGSSANFASPRTGSVSRYAA